MEHQIPLFEVICEGPASAFHQTIITVQPGGETERHYHKVTIETYVVMSGTGCIAIDDTEHKIKGDDHLLVKKGEWHQIKNTGSEPLRILSTKNRPKEFKDMNAK